MGIIPAFFNFVFSFKFRGLLLGHMSESIFIWVVLLLLLLLFFVALHYIKMSWFHSFPIIQFDGDWRLYHFKI